MGIFALNDIYIKINQMNPISDKIQALIDNMIAEARKAPEPEPLSNLFNDNPTAKCFSIVQRLKGGGETEYDFRFEDQNGHKMIRDINKATKTKGCLADAHVDTMIYGDQFKLNFGKCGSFTLNNVVGVKLYADENAIKAGQPLDTYELDTDLGKGEDELINQYYQTLKNLQVGDEIYLDSKFKWDGEVSQKFGDTMNVEINRDGVKGQPINLQINLSQNPFYSGELGVMFKAKANKRDENATPVKFDIPIKKFSFNQKVKPKKEAPKKGESENKKTDDELRIDAEEAIKAITSDPTLKAAFYTQPSFMELLKAEITGKKAVGKGIITTLNLVRNYHRKQSVDKIKETFKNNGRVAINIPNGLTLTDVNEQKMIFNSRSKYITNVDTQNLGEILLVGDYKNITTKTQTRYYVSIEEELSEVDEFLCDFFVRDNEGNKKNKVSNVKIKIIKGDSSGYKSKGDLSATTSDTKQKSRFAK